MSFRITAGRASSLAEGKTRKFRFTEDGCEREGFVIRWQGKLYAYTNRCRHIPMTLDWVSNRFLSRDGRHIQCATHGALYEIDTGYCVSGPPAGQALKALAVLVEADRIVITSLP